MEAVTAVWGRKARRFMLKVDKAQMVDMGESGRRRNTVDNGTDLGQSENKRRLCDQTVTCDSWQRIHVFGGGPWNKGR